MILYEYEAKQLLFDTGINVPLNQLVDSPTQEIKIKPPFVLKAQVLSGNRAQEGGIIILENDTNLKSEILDLLNETIKKEKVTKILIEEKIEYEKSFYLSLSYDTDSRLPILSLSEEGGSGIEKRANLKTFSLDPLKPIKNLPQLIDQSLLEKIINLFFSEDCLLLEINPLVKTTDNRWIALDAKIKLDDSSLNRHPNWDFPPRSAPGHTPTQREIEAKKIDEGDYRGVAGSAYFDLEGDIAVLASGGGASLTAMDALIKIGGKPSNYTEYSGNPPKEKVTKLTKIVLSKSPLNGLWVVGAIANFTDIYETLSGFIEGLRQAEKELDTKFNFPIVIRRGGPRDLEAFEMLKQITYFDLHLYGEELSITQSAKIMLDLANQFKNKI